MVCNTYGIWLEHFRTGMLWSIARTDKHPTLKDDQIYDSYLAEKGLKLALHYENLDNISKLMLIYKEMAWLKLLKH